MQVLEVEKKGKREKNTNSESTLSWCNYLWYLFAFVYTSSPYPCVCGDDHVTCYMGADVDASEQVGV